MCAQLVQQAKRAVKSKMTLAGTVSGAMLVSAFLWADTEHNKLEQDCQSRIDLACEKIDDVYAEKSDVEVLKAIMQRVEKKLDKLNDKVDEMEDW